MGRWAQQTLLPLVLETHTHSNYLYRMTSLYAIGALAAVVQPDAVSSTMLPLVLQMSADPVPNVRFNAAKTLRQLAPLLDSVTVHERVKPCLSSLSDDHDSDVSYFARQGLQSC